MGDIDGAAPFIAKLWHVLEDPENEPMISWRDDATIVVNDETKFVAKVMHLMCKSKVFPSFVRQLNGYGFSKTDAAAYAWSHPSFLRNHPELLASIVRKRSVSSKGEDLDMGGATRQQLQRQSSLGSASYGAAAECTHRSAALNATGNSSSSSHSLWLGSIGSPQHSASVSTMLMEQQQSSAVFKSLAVAATTALRVAVLAAEATGANSASSVIPAVEAFLAHARTALPGLIHPAAPPDAASSLAHHAQALGHVIGALSGMQTGGGGAAGTEALSSSSSSHAGFGGASRARSDHPHVPAAAQGAGPMALLPFSTASSSPTHSGGLRSPAARSSPASAAAGSGAQPRASSSRRRLTGKKSGRRIEASLPTAGPATASAGLLSAEATGGPSSVAAADAIGLSEDEEGEEEDDESYISGTESRSCAGSGATGSYVGSRVSVRSSSRTAHSVSRPSSRAGGPGSEAEEAGGGGFRLEEDASMREPPRKSSRPSSPRQHQQRQGSTYSRASSTSSSAQQLAVHTQALTLGSAPAARSRQQAPVAVQPGTAAATGVCLSYSTGVASGLWGQPHSASLDTAAAALWEAAPSHLFNPFTGAVAAPRGTPVVPLSRVSTRQTRSLPSGSLLLAPGGADRGWDSSALSAVHHHHPSPDAMQPSGQLLVQQALVSSSASQRRGSTPLPPVSPPGSSSFSSLFAAGAVAGCGVGPLPSTAGQPGRPLLFDLPLGYYGGCATVSSGSAGIACEDGDGSHPAAAAATAARGGLLVPPPSQMMGLAAATNNSSMLGMDSARDVMALSLSTHRGALLPPQPPPRYGALSVAVPPSTSSGTAIRAGQQLLVRTDQPDQQLMMMRSDSPQRRGSLPADEEDCEDGRDVLVGASASGAGGGRAIAAAAAGAGAAVTPSPFAALAAAGAHTVSGHAALCVPAAATVQLSGDGPSAAQLRKHSSMHSNGSDDMHM